MVLINKRDISRWVNGGQTTEKRYPAVSVQRFQLESRISDKCRPEGIDANDDNQPVEIDLQNCA